MSIVAETGKSMLGGSVSFYQISGCETLDPGVRRGDDEGMGTCRGDDIAPGSVPYKVCHTGASRYPPDRLRSPGPRLTPG